MQPGLRLAMVVEVVSRVMRPRRPGGPFADTQGGWRERRWQRRRALRGAWSSGRYGYRRWQMAMLVLMLPRQRAREFQEVHGHHGPRTAFLQELLETLDTHA